MLHRDFIADAIEQFGRAVRRWLRPALLERDLESVQGIEQAIGRLLELDGAEALSLSPQSLVTMMQLSGIADSVAGYVSYTLLRLGDAYDAMGDSDTAAVRRQQAAAVASSFGCELGTVPEEYEDLERMIAEERAAQQD